MNFLDILKFENPLIVGYPELPNIDEFKEGLNEIWASKIVSNNGPKLKLFENQLKQYLGVQHVIVFNNATTALISLINALKLKGKIITTPFSFIATANSISLSNLEIKFLDICKETYNLNPKNITTIAKKTSAIMPVHVFSNPAFVEEFRELSQHYKIKLIYDASHAFGANYKNKSLLDYGDASVVSFHATKIFNTLEGGAIVTSNEKLADKLKQFRNFGISENGLAYQIGLNGKMNEVLSLVGILQLKNIKLNLSKRKKIYGEYIDSLKDINNIKLPCKIVNHENNYSYFPIEVKNNNRNYLFKRLNENHIYCKKYFYPIIPDHPVYGKFKNQKFPISRMIAENIICLPINPNMTKHHISKISNLIRDEV